MNGLLTDLYELTMAAGYFAAGKHLETATFELTIRRLPRNRDFVVAAGLHQAVDYLTNLRFTANEIAYLRGLPSLLNASPDFWDYLSQFRFTGDVFAVPEGTVLYEGQPVMNVRAPLIEGQIPETYLLAAIGYETLVATKAARIVHAAEGREIIEFGTRRAHTPEAGVLGARAAYIGGCAGTSNTLAGYRFGIPVLGTAAHSWVMSFASESEAFERLQRLLGERTVHLIDTYDTLEGARTAARLGKPLWGVRIDSGDLAQLSRDVRVILDNAGLQDARIMASGDLDESKIAALMSAGAAIDAFGVGTELTTSADAPSIGAVYKMVAIGNTGNVRYPVKSSPQKHTIPGAKQLFRLPGYDVLGLATECVKESEALLKPVILGGKVIEALPDVNEIRRRASLALRPWPTAGRRTEFSPKLKALVDQAHSLGSPVPPLPPVSSPVGQALPPAGPEATK
jgi:nicotinate phosphoribosyltransferase